MLQMRKAQQDTKRRGCYLAECWSTMQRLDTPLGWYAPLLSHIGVQVVAAGPYS